MSDQIICIVSGCDKPGKVLVHEDKTRALRVSAVLCVDHLGAWGFETANETMADQYRDRDLQRRTDAKPERVDLQGDS